MSDCPLVGDVLTWFTMPAFLSLSGKELVLAPYPSRLLVPGTLAGWPALESEMTALKAGYMRFWSGFHHCLLRH